MPCAGDWRQLAVTDKNAISRRRLLKTAVAFGAPYIIPSTVLGQGRPAPSNRIGVGCIGLRNMGMTHLLSVLGRSEVEVIGLCDVDRSVLAERERLVRLRKLGGACATYTDFRELLARDDVDAVTVATPDHWHVPIGIAAAKAGKDMYIEKPLSLTISQGRALVDAVRRYGRVSQTGTQQRSEYGFRFACELVQNGRIGQLQTIRVGLPAGPQCPPQKTMPVPKGFDYEMWLGPSPWAPYTRRRCHGSFRYIFDYSGGQITDWGAHFIDIAQWGNGTQLSGPVEVEGRGEFPRDGLFNTARKYRFVCTYANGVKLIVSDEERFGIHSEGSEGWVFVNRTTLEADPPTLIRSRIGANEIHLYESRSHWGNWLECIRTRGQTIAHFEIGHRTITIAHLGNLSMLLGRKLRWNPDEERFVNDDVANRMLTRAMREPWRL